MRHVRLTRGVLFAPLAPFGTTAPPGVCVRHLCHSVSLVFAPLAPFGTTARLGLSLSPSRPPGSLSCSPCASLSLSVSVSDTASSGTRYQRGGGCSAQRTEPASSPPPSAPGCPQTRRPLTSQQPQIGVTRGSARRVWGVDGGVGWGGGRCGGALRPLSGCDALN